MDDGSPVSYMVLQEGVAVRSSDGQPVGTVHRVLAADAQDIFDGIVVDAECGHRFVDADQIEAIYERAVVLSIDAEAARRLPEPDENPVPVDAMEELGGRDPQDQGVGGAARRAWDRLKGE